MLLSELGRIVVGVDAVGIHLLGLSPDHFIIHINPLAVLVDIHERVAIVAAAHVQGAHHQAVDAVGLIEPPLVVVATLVGDDGVFLENVHIGAVIIQVIEDGIVVHAEHLYAGLDHGSEGAVEPQQVLLLDVPVTHLHERAAIHAHDHQAAHGEHKPVAAPQVVERLAGTLAPVILVIAGNDIERPGDIVKNALNVAQLLVTALVGEVAREHHRIHVGGINLGHSLAQLALVGIARRDMHITQDSQPDHPTPHGQ